MVKIDNREISECPPSLTMTVPELQAAVRWAKLGDALGTPQIQSQVHAGALTYRHAF